MLLFSHPTGNANVRHAALGLRRAGLLGEFWTCFNYREGPMLRKLLPGSVSGQLRRRAYPAELTEHMRSFPYREIGRLLAPRAGLHSLARHESGVFSLDAVYQSLDRKVSSRLRSGKFQGVYAYEDGAYHAFRTAGDRGLLRFYDLPIGYWGAARSILQEEAEREPEWAATLTGNRDSSRKTARKDAELREADLVLVASQFTLSTLDRAPDFKGTVAVIPYGAPSPAAAAVANAPARPPGAPGGDKLRVLFVGSLGQRKGMSYLFRACKRLRGAVELTVIGRQPIVSCAALDRELKEIRWIPSCSHSRVLAEMASHDVFVFPSLFEGFGLVLLEAMSMGMPIITTPNTAGPDLLTDGEEGFIVPIRSEEAIMQKLELLRADPARRAAMGEKARQRARGFTWDAYGQTLAACVTSALVRR